MTGNNSNSVKKELRAGQSVILHDQSGAGRAGTDAESIESQSFLRRADEARWPSGPSIQIDRIRRYKWLVAAIALISTIGGVASAASMTTEYTGQAVLSVASPATAVYGNAPLAQGYVFVFNDPAYQTGLSQRAKVSGHVSSYSARTASLGPLFYITATSTSADTARSAAAAMARTFADEVNSRLKAGRDQTIATLSDQIREVWGERLETGDEAAFDVQMQLQQQINNLNADRANQVTVMQLDGGVSGAGSGRVKTVGAALVGGLLLGCGAAVLAGVSSRRLVTDYDVAEKLGLDPLDVLPNSSDKRHSGSRIVRLRHLANLLARWQADRPTAIAIAPAASGRVDEVAEAIATQRAAQSVPTVLVRADLHDAGDESAGLAELLDPGHPADVDSVLQASSENLHVIAPGKVSDDPYASFDRQRFSAVVDALRGRASFIIIESPPLSRAAEAQVISDISDGTLLIINQGTRVDDAREAVRVLNQTGANLVGVVLVEKNTRSFPRSAKAALNDDNPKAAVLGSDDTQIVGLGSAAARPSK